MPQLIPTDNLDHPELLVFSSAKEVALLRINEPKPGIFIAESHNVIARALAGGYTPLYALIEDDRVNEANGLFANFPDLKVYVSDHAHILRLSGYELTGGMLCAFARKELTPANSFLTLSRLVVLENITNPTNIGAIFRSAAALNMDAILLTHGCSNPLYRRSLRVGMGTAFQIPWTYLDKDANAVDFIAKLHNSDYCCLAMALCDRSIGLDDPRLLKLPRLAVFFGNEKEGLNDATIRACDYTVRIPMSHQVDSLNVAAASAVAFWQLGHF